MTFATDKAINFAQEHVESARQRLLDAVISDVKAIIRQYPFVDEYVQGMGSYFFNAALAGESITVDPDRPHEVLRTWIWEAIPESDREKYLKFCQDVEKIRKVHHIWISLFGDHLAGTPFRTDRTFKVTSAW